jgi:hypothetical protein
MDLKMLYMLSHVSFYHLIQMQDDQELNLVHNEWCPTTIN